MSISFSTILISIISSTFVAIITALVTVKLSTKSFYSKHWWEKKVELYSNIIKTLTCLKKYTSEWCSSFEGNRALDSIESDELTRKYSEKRGELREIEAYGKLIISNRANERLKNCLDKLDNSNDNNKNKENVKKYLYDCLNILENCIDDFINIAKEDLNIK